MIMRSPFDGFGNVIYPLFFATVAFFVFQAGSSPRTLVYASLGAAVMGMWSSVSTSAGSAMQRERWWGTLELLVAAPRHFALVLLPATLGLATVGIYRPRRDAALGTPPVRDRPARSSTRCCSRSRSSARCSRSAASASCSPSRSSASARAWVLGNFFEYPVWLICGFLVPLSLLPSWVSPDRLGARADLGHARDPRVRARRDAAAATCSLCLGLGAAYVAVGVLVTDRVLRAARVSGSLSLT